MKRRVESVSDDSDFHLQCMKVFVYLDVYAAGLGRTQQFATSVATLVYCPETCHLHFWQGQPAVKGHMVTATSNPGLPHP